MAQKRIRAYGVHIGTMPTGPRNQITDVPGVRVGHATVDTPAHKTGVTVILPCAHNLFTQKLIAAGFVWNGYGKTLGLVQLDELGTLETPIALTNTLNVGLVHDALVEYTLRRCRADGVEPVSINPVVGECNDSRLNRIAERAVQAEQVFAAIDSASEDFAEGDVGAGKGTTCYGWKSGIGSASRRLELDGRTYTVGALVQTNFGRSEDLMIAGRPVGRALAAQQRREEEDKGSVMTVLATDLPVSDRQLRRILRRAAVGLARTGAQVSHGSGEVMLGFSTAQTVSDDGPAVRVYSMVGEGRLDEAFRAAIESVEEAVLNSLAAAQSVTGYDGTRYESIAPYLEQFYGTRTGAC